MQTRTLDLLCLGEPLYEFNQEPDGRYVGGHGGDTANCAVAAARCGARSGMLTHLGNDRFGNSFLQLWEQEGVDTRWVRSKNAEETGVYFVTHDDDGHHFSYRRRHSAAALMGAADVPQQAIADTDVLHVSGISLAISSSAADAVFTAIEHAKNNNIRVSFDTNLRLALAPLARSRALFLDVARHCDLLLPGLDDAQALTGLEHEDAIVDYFLNAGCPLVAMTLGSRGVLMASPQERYTVPAFTVDAIDATGAGDTFDGAFLSQWVKGLGPRAAAEFANAAAALSTTRRGAIAAMPRYEDVERFQRSTQAAQTT